MNTENTRIVPANNHPQTILELIAMSEILTDHPGIKPKWAKKGVVLFGDDDKSFKEFDQKGME